MKRGYIWAGLLLLAICLLAGTVFCVAEGSVEGAAVYTVDSGSCGYSLTWVLDSEGTVTISGTGAMSNYPYAQGPWFDAGRPIYSVVIEPGATSIGSYAFRNSDTLTSVSIPNTVRSIETCAFSEDHALCDVVLPQGVTSINLSAFLECTSLPSMFIPSTVTYISPWAFAGCTGLTSFSVSSSNAGYTAVNGVLFNKDKTDLVYYPMGNSRTSYSIPNTVTKIAYTSFYGAANLRSVYIPSSVATIEQYAFSGCSGLTSVTLPDSVTNIGSAVFMDCSALTEVTLSKHIREITADMFWYCESLRSVVIPDGVTRISGQSFINCSALRSVTLPATLREIGESAFRFCSSLEQVTFRGTRTAWEAVTVGNLNEYLTNASFTFQGLAAYTIDYNANGGVEAPESQVKTQDVSLRLSENAPVRTGYAFMGWSLSSTATSGTWAAGSYFDLNQNATLYAVWQPVTYAITYDANGGTNAPLSQSGLYGSVVTLSTGVPVRDSYVFLGWSASQSAGTATYQPGDSYTIRDDIVLYAVWRLRTYTISYDANGGSGAPSSQTKTHGVPLTLSSVRPTRTGYDFLGWALLRTMTTAAYQPGGSFTGNADTTLFAVWRLATYTISYDANGGTGAPQDQTKTHGVALTLSDVVPTREGYDLVGWGLSVASTGSGAYQPGGSFDRDMDTRLYALWKYKTYTVTFDANGGSNAPASMEKTHSIPLRLSESPTRRGYFFLGWSLADDATSATWGQTDLFELEGDTILYAVWSQNEFTVSYDACGGSGAPASQTKIRYGDLTLSSDVPVWEGRDFLGWRTSVTDTAAAYQPGDNFTVDADTTLYALWRASTYTVHFDANGGAGAPEDQIKTYGVALTLSSAVPTRTGHTFLGWKAPITATAPSFQPGDSYTVNGDITLYAVWETDTFTIHYDAGNGSGAPADQVKTYGVSLTLSTEEPSWTGHVFVGWRTSSTATTVAYQPGDSFTLNEETTLYALWRMQTFTVHYDANGGAGAPADQTKTYGVDLILSDAVPTRENGTFLGWAADPDDPPQWQPGAAYKEDASATLYAIWQLKSNFDVGQDAYSFDNSAASFGYTSTAAGRNYPMKYRPAWVLLFGDNTLSENLYGSWRSNEWGGNCNGMAATVALLYDEELLSAGGFGADHIASLATEDSNGSYTIKTFIEAMMFSQWSAVFNEERMENRIGTADLNGGSTRLDSLCATVKNAGARDETVLVAIEATYIGGHALLAYDLETVSATHDRLLIYDCNHPGETRYLDIYRNAQGRATGWSYDMGRYGLWGTEGSFASRSYISCITLDTLSYIWENRGRLQDRYGVLIVDSDNLTITDIDGNEVARIEDGRLITPRSDIFEVANLWISTMEEHVIYLPQDFYTLISDDAGTLTASMSDGNVGATVQTTAEAISFLVDESAALNTVFIENASASDTFAVTLSSTASGVRYQNVTVNGTGKGETLRISGDDDVLALANCNIESLSINGVQQIRYVVSAYAGPGGAISPAGDTTVEVGRDITFTITPDVGYAISSVLVDGVSVGTDAIVTLENVLKEHTISVSFRKAYEVEDIVYDRSDGTVEIALTNDARAKLICAAYDEEGRMIALRLRTVAANCGSTTVTLPAGLPRGTTIRAMLANTQWIPLCSSFDLPL